MRKGQIDYAPVVERIERLMLTLSDPILPITAIEPLLVEQGVELGSKQYERLRKAYRRNVERGTGDLHHVDEMCVAVLRRHPAELYGDDWYDAA